MLLCLSMRLLLLGMLLWLLLRLCLSVLLRLCLNVLLRLWRSAGRNDRSNRSAYRNRLCRSENGRTPVVHRGKLLVVLCCFVLVL